MTRPVVESRGTCTTCGRVVHVRLDGGFRLHRGLDGQGCSGSHSRPVFTADPAASAELAALLGQHYPHPVFGCECTAEDAEAGVKEFLSEPWEQHVAAVVMGKKFSQVSALIAPSNRETIGGVNNNGPTGCTTTPPDLDEQHLCERNRLP